MSSQELVSFTEDELFAAVLDQKTNRPRLGVARAFFGFLTQSEIPYLTAAFSYWRDYTEFLVLEGENRLSGEKKFHAVKCSKRGNDVYGERTKRNLGFLKGAENLEFFKPSDFEADEIIKVKTRLLWVTFTWDSKLCSLDDSWYRGGYFWNLAITNLRNRYGRIQAIKFPQASPGKGGKAYGYQHFHAVLLFQDHEFSVFPWMDDDGKLEYRIHERDEFKDQAKWHSWIDIKAISSMRGIHAYAVKHHINAGFGDSEEATLNNAVCWLFKKKSYTISGDFRKSYSEFIHTMRNSKVFQLTLDGGRLPDWVWSLVGVCSSSQFRDIGIFPGSSWDFSLSIDQVDQLLGGRPERYD